MESGREWMEASPLASPRENRRPRAVFLPTRDAYILKYCLVHFMLGSASLLSRQTAARGRQILPPGRRSPGWERPRPLHLGPCGPPPSGSLQAPSPPPARWLFLANGGPLPHSPALCRMLGLASAHPAISQTWLTHCLPEDTFPDFQPGSGPHHPLMELPAASLGQTSNTLAALG